MTTKDLVALRHQLMDHEGLRLRVYKDTLGIETIGVGRNLRDRGITNAEAMHLLDNDIEDCLADCLTFPWFVTLDATRQIALIDLRFNLGHYKLRLFKQFLAALSVRDYDKAAEQLLASKWATQVQPNRVRRIVSQIRYGAETA